MVSQPRTAWPDTKSRRYPRRYNRFCALLKASAGPARSCCLVLALLLIPAEARAHFHKAGAFGAVSWAKGSKLVGFQLSVERPFTKLQSPDNKNAWKPMTSVFADVGANWGEHENGERTQATGMVGARSTWGDGRLQPSLHLALVAVHTQDSAANYSETPVGLGVGASLSLQLVEESPGITGVLLRAQYDVVVLGGPEAPIQRYQRLSVGIELRFPRSH